MKMKEVIQKLVTKFGPKDSDLSTVTKAILKHMPDKDVPDATYRKIVGIGNALKKAGVPR